LRDDVLNVVRGATGTSLTENPIIRIGFEVCNLGGKIQISEFSEEDIGIRTSDSRMEMLSLLRTTRGTKRRLEEVNERLLAEFVKMNREMKALRTMVQRRLNQPAEYTRRSSPFNIRNNPEVSLETQPIVSIHPAAQFRKPARLAKGVKDLYMLWNEFETGLDGNKAAKDFTPQERGKCKALYSIRKVFWDQVLTLTRRGHSYDSAIDKIYVVYGRSLPVTKILTKLRHDRMNGGNVALQ